MIKHHIFYIANALLAAANGEIIKICFRKIKNKDELQLDIGGVTLDSFALRIICLE